MTASYPAVSLVFAGNPAVTTDAALLYNNGGGQILKQDVIEKGDRDFFPGPLISHTCIATTLERRDLFAKSTHDDSMPILPLLRTLTYI